MAMNQRNEYGIVHPGNRELNDLLKKVEKKTKPKKMGDQSHGDDIKLIEKGNETVKIGIAKFIYMD